MEPISARSANDMNDKNYLDLSKYADIIDPVAFGEILEMDDEDEDQKFSEGIVYGFFEQAKETFEKMKKAISAEELGELSSLGHFLKGSSATLGLIKVKDACEKIQHYGAGKDELGGLNAPDKETSLNNIKKTLIEVRKDYDEAARVLKRFYGEDLGTNSTNDIGKGVKQV